MLYRYLNSDKTLLLYKLFYNPKYSWNSHQVQALLPKPGDFDKQRNTTHPRHAMTSQHALNRTKNAAGFNQDNNLKKAMNGASLAYTLDKE